MGILVNGINVVHVKRYRKQEGVEFHIAPLARPSHCYYGNSVMFAVNIRNLGVALTDENFIPEGMEYSATVISYSGQLPKVVKIILPQLFEIRLIRFYGPRDTDKIFFAI